jgi:phage regulator Rha-like protein
MKGDRGMKSKEEILRRIEQIKTEQLQNEDRKQHFYEESDIKKTQIYNRMINENNAKLDMLYWVLNQE